MDKRIVVARCHEIQLVTGDKEIHRFEGIPEIGMAVRLALHIRGLPAIEYEILKLVASSLLGIPRLAVERIVNVLAEVEFVRILKQGNTIKSVIPTVPFFDDLYDGLADYAQTNGRLDEFERLTIEIVDKLAAAPSNIDALAAAINADRKAFDESVGIGQKANFLLSRRHRSRNILLNPTYFSENADIFADHVAKSGAPSVQRALELVRSSQGWPLSLIEAQKEIAGRKVQPEDVALLKRLAQDGMIKPPSINTKHAGQAIFMFTPTPGHVNLSPLKREVYERALAIVSAVRLGQLLPSTFRIRSPGAVLYTLRRDHQLSPTSDYADQYKNLVHMRVARLEQVGSRHQLKIIDTPENREALDTAYDLVQGGSTPDLSVDNDAVRAMASSQEYVESLVSSRQMRDKESVKLSEEQVFELEQILLEGR
jgi:hypothetical protein